MISYHSKAVTINWDFTGAASLQYIKIQSNNRLSYALVLAVFLTLYRKNPLALGLGIALGGLLTRTDNSRSVVLCTEIPWVLPSIKCSMPLLLMW